MAIIPASQGNTISNMQQTVCYKLSAFLGGKNLIGLRIDNYTKISLNLIPNSPTVKYFNDSQQYKTEYIFSFLVVEEKSFNCIQTLEQIRFYFTTLAEELKDDSVNEWWRIQGIKSIGEPNYIGLYEDGKSYMFQMSFSVIVTYHN